MTVHIFNEETKKDAETKEQAQFLPVSKKERDLDWKALLFNIPIWDKFWMNQRKTCLTSWLLDYLSFLLLPTGNCLIILHWKKDPLIKCYPTSVPGKKPLSFFEHLKAKIVETTFVVSCFSDILCFFPLLLFMITIKTLRFKDLMS